ncbi:hypothetical protein Vi05172_g3184 [Venturia inaequalis]|nr:hypothetical protein Vi05172_g3184 [Venturia inaequalis]
MTLQSRCTICDTSRAPRHSVPLLGVPLESFPGNQEEPAILAYAPAGCMHTINTRLWSQTDDVRSVGSNTTAPAPTSAFSPALPSTLTPEPEYEADAGFEESEVTMWIKISWLLHREKPKRGKINKLEVPERL